MKKLLIFTALILGMTVNPALAGKQEMVAGVLHIINEATPSEGVQTVALTEKWRTGGEDEDVLLGVITQVRCDDAGNVYLLDMQLSQVDVFSPVGDFIGTLSKEGEGPGETRLPQDMVFFPDGTLGLVQAFPGKIIRIDLDDNPVKDTTIGSGDPTQGGLVRLNDANCHEGSLIVGGISITPSATGQRLMHFIASVAEDGTEQVRYFEKEQIMDLSDLAFIEAEMDFPHYRRWTVGLDGRIYVPVARNRYVINVYNADGSLDRVIEREFTSRPRDEQELALVNSLMEGVTAQIPVPVRIETEDTEPDISRLMIDDEGNLWVQHSRSGYDQPDGILFTYDIFDPEGNFIRQQAIACAGDSRRDGMIFAGKGRFVLVTGFVDAMRAMAGGGSGAGDEEEAAPMEVIYLEI